MTSRRRKWQEAGDRLRNITESAEAANILTPDELDWVHLLRDRFFEISNRMKREAEIQWTEDDSEARVEASMDRHSHILDRLHG